MKKWLLGALCALLVSPTFALEPRYVTYQLDEGEVRLLSLRSIQDLIPICEPLEAGYHREHCIGLIVSMTERYAGMATELNILSDKKEDIVRPEKRQLLINDAKEAAEFNEYRWKQFVDKYIGKNE